MRFIFILICFTSNFFSQTYPWAQQRNYKGIGQSVAVDTRGGLAIAETYSVMSAKPGVFIIRYDSNRTETWRKKIEGKYFCNVNYYDILVDKNGNTYFTSTAIDSVFINGALYRTTSAGDMLLVKYDVSGNLLWVRQSKGASAAEGGGGMKLSTDPSGNIYVAGTAGGKNAFDNFSLEGVQGGVYFFLAKYNSSGQIQWLKYNKEGLLSSSGLGLETDSVGNTYIAGTFFSKLILDSISVFGYGSYPDEDIFLAKIDSSGKWLWARHDGGIDQDVLNDLSLDIHGRVVVTGFFSSTNTTFGSFHLNSNGNDNLFIAKYTSSGDVLWAKDGQASGIQRGMKICIDQGGMAYVAGYNVFLGKFDSTGSYLGSEIKNASLIDMALDKTGCIYFTGNVASQPVSFGSYSFFSYSYSPFVAEYCNSTLANVGELSLGQNDFLLLYPNPTNGILNVVVTSETNKERKLIIRNVVGQVVYEQTTKKGQDHLFQKIDLSSAQKGVYFVEVTEGGIRIAKKFILQ